MPLRNVLKRVKQTLILTEYCDFMEDYLSKELLSKQMEGLLRKEYEGTSLAKT